MRKTFLLAMLCACCCLAKAQTSQTEHAFSAYSTAMNKKLSEASQRKDRKQLLTLINEWFEAYEKEPAAVQKNFKSYLPNMYYNLACYQALENLGELAITSFQKAVDAGYVNYAHALKDSDLDGLRTNKHFIAALQQMRLKGDYTYILKTAGDYRTKAYPTTLPPFTYQKASATALVNFRNKFNLDSITGKGDEISKIKNLLYWVHNLIRHDGNSSNPRSKNAIDLIEVCQKENRGVNCRMLATVLKDAYLAMGFESRAITCMPKDTADFDCHVINIVWSKSLNKWLWMDPTNNAFVSDDKGNLLSTEEVRQRLVNDQPLVLNENANWNNKQKQTKAQYLDYYMSKNLYWLQCTVKSEWNLETQEEGKPIVEYINLYPGAYSTIGNQAKEQTKSLTMYATGNAAYFWKKP